MAEEKEAPEILVLKGHLTELAKMVSEKKELEGILQKECEEELEKISGLREQISALEDLIVDAEAKMEERSPRTYSALKEAEKEITHKEDAIKVLCHGLPPEMLTATRKVEVDGASITISKVTIRTEYRAEDLLDAHPELSEMYVDGDGVVSYTINGPVLDRLIAEGKFKEEDAAPFRIVTKVKNPSVSINGGK